MRGLRNLVAIGVALVLLGSLSACGQDAAAKVNGETVTAEQLQAKLDAAKKSFPEYFQGADAAQQEARIKKQLLDELVNGVLIEQAAKEQGVTVTDAELKAQLAKLRSSFKSDAEYQSALKSAGLDPSGVSDQLRSQLLTLALIRKANPKGFAPSEADIEKYYADYKAEFQQTASRRASHILVKDKSTAEKLLAELKAGADFATLAKESSIDTASAAVGGDLDWQTQQYVAEFQAALDSLKVGQLSPIVKTQFGYHIIKLTDVRESKQLTLAEAKQQIVSQMTQERQTAAYQKLLEDLRKKAKIEILIKLPADATTNSTETAPAQ